VIIGPSLVLALIIGIFHTALFVLIRGNGGGAVPLLLLAAVLGAWAGDAIGTYMGWDFGRIGDFHVITASVVAWIGLLLTAVAVVIGPARKRA
jgi:hypothetical protein